MLPERPETHSLLGLVLAELDRFDEAVACHRQAIALRPGNALLHAALGRSLFRGAQLEASEASYRQALAVAPDQAKIWHWLGYTLLADGRIEEAVSCFQRALEIEPDLAEARGVSLARNGLAVGDETQLRRLANRLAGSDHPISDRATAGFALGTYLNNANRPDEAFPYFRAANVLGRQLLADAGERFDADALAREVDGVIERCSAALFAAASGWGSRSEVPVFIVGMPRSGTSLVEQIVAIRRCSAPVNARTFPHCRSGPGAQSRPADQ